MDTAQGVGLVLVAGLVVFAVGAVRWRMAYQAPLEQALPVVHAEAGRWRWISAWMIVAMFFTPAGLLGLASLPVVEGTYALMAAAVYGVGAVCWIASLSFRITVHSWAAERTSDTGVIPDGFDALSQWAGLLYTAHMASAYAAFAVLGVAVLAADHFAPWVGWLGIGGGVAFLAGFVATRFAGPFNPPFWAHTYTTLIGVLLLLQ
jgi:hypothetical protein